MITLVYLVSVLVNSWSKEREENYGTPACLNKCMSVKLTLMP